jgi:hypothetical protein
MHLRCLEVFRRHRYRHDAVVTLAQAGTPMLVVGQEWDRLSLPHNVQVQPHVDYERLFHLAASAKICLDVSPYFDGVNDRVFTYAINRAVCFTNASGYLPDALGESAGIRFYSLRNPDSLVEEVHSLLARQLTLTALGELAHNTVIGAHTWRHRVEQVLAAVFMARRSARSSPGNSARDQAI